MKAQAYLSLYKKSVLKNIQWV